MLCQRCNERPASVHLTQIVGIGKTEYHLCETCAKEQGEIIYKAAHGLDFNQLLSRLLSMESSPGAGMQAAVAPTAIRCSTCGMTYQQFTKVGRFGCPDCYENFSPRLDTLLRRIQSNTSHTGKIPVHAGEQVKTRKALERLRKELQESIALEQFERAAQIRDQIRHMEQQSADQ
jgi:protein arginine kinase activator